MKKILTYLSLLILVMSCNNSTDLDLRSKVIEGNDAKNDTGIFKDESGIYIEHFIETDTNKNKYTVDNLVYKQGNVFSYSYFHISKSDDTLLFQIEENQTDWNFISRNSDSKSNIVKHINLEILNGIGHMNNNYDQTVIDYSYNDSILISQTGVVDNHKNIWLHPPRFQYFKILEINPFPFIQSPYQVGNKWSWELEVNSLWGDKRWKEWKGNIIIKSEYEITHFDTINTILGPKPCYEITAISKSVIGETKLVSWFSFELGFVKLDYTNIDSSKTVMKLIRKKNSHFQNYEYEPKEIVFGENKALNYKTETTFIGVTNINSLKYNVFTEFRKIQLANSVRGRSALFFINNQIEDTLEYDCGMPDILPIDIYDDYFVFKRNEDSTYVFSRLRMEIKDIICFDGIECFSLN